MKIDRRLISNSLIFAVFFVLSFGVATACGGDNDYYNEYNNPQKIKPYSSITVDIEGLDITAHSFSVDTKVGRVVCVAMIRSKGGGLSCQFPEIP